jgi:hypothetical protein
MKPTVLVTTTIFHTFAVSKVFDHSMKKNIIVSKK